jgi:hypothetical protein
LTSRRSTWRSAGEDRCAPPAPSITRTKARSIHRVRRSPVGSQPKGLSGAWAPSATRSTTRCAKACRDDEDRETQPAALALRLGGPRCRLRMDRELVQPPPPALKPRLSPLEFESQHQTDTRSPTPKDPSTETGEAQFAASALMRVAPVSRGTRYPCRAGIVGSPVVSHRRRSGARDRPFVPLFPTADCQVRGTVRSLWVSNRPRSGDGPLVLQDAFDPARPEDELRFEGSR